MYISLEESSPCCYRPFNLFLLFPTPVTTQTFCFHQLRRPLSPLSLFSPIPVCPPESSRRATEMRTTSRGFYGALNPSILGGFDLDKDEDTAMAATSDDSSIRLSGANGQPDNHSRTPFRYKSNPSLLDDLLEPEPSSPKGTPGPKQESIEPSLNRRKSYYSPVANSILADFDFHAEAQDQPRPPTPSPRRIECVVCSETKDSQEFPQLPVSVSCSHETRTCSSCVSAAIRSDLESKLWTEICCPECEERLEYADVQRHGDEETFLR